MMLYRESRSSFRVRNTRYEGDDSSRHDLNDCMCPKKEAMSRAVLARRIAVLFVRTHQCLSTQLYATRGRAAILTRQFPHSAEHRSQ